MIKSWIVYLIWLLLVLALNIFTQTSGAFIVLFLSILLPAISIVLNFLIRSRPVIKIDFPDSTGKEELIEGRLIISNRALIPFSKLYIKIINENVFTSERFVLEELVPISMSSSSYSLKCRSKHCGKLLFSIEEAKLYNIFGLTYKRCNTKNTDSIIVYPDMFIPEIMENSAHGVLGDTNRYSELKPGYDLAEQFAIREYRHGDQVKSIHWKLSQKLDKIMVREPGLPMQNSTLLLFESGYISDEKPIPEICDAMAEAFISISQALSEQNSPHVVGWHNTSTDTFESFEIQNEEDCIGILPKILSIGMVRNDVSCVEEFLEINGGCDFSHILCISSHENKDILLPESVNLTVLFCNLEQRESKAEMISFCPQTIHQDLGILRI